jgi:acyl carrier protein
VVAVHEDPVRGKVLVAYVVPKSPGAIDPQRLRSHAKEKLPAYMVPAAFILLAQLPLNRNGKVDRKALPPPDFSQQDSAAAGPAPRTATEAELTRLMAELFQLPRVGIFDNFFELGGNSLMATQLVSRLRKAFQVEFPLRLFFADPTAAGLAESLEQIRWATQAQAPADGEPEASAVVGQL